jgi:hypothetical protein
MNPPDQDQHKVPQVYLKKFGYKTENNQWKVSVLKRGERFTRQKSIESFTIVTNIFDIESDDPRIPRIFEELNGELENEFNHIIAELDAGKDLSDKSCAMLLQTAANLICRSDIWREFVLGILNHKNKENFLKTIVGHNAKNFEEFEKILELPHYKILVDLPAEKAVNRVLLYFFDHLWLRLQHFEVVVLKSQDGKPWFTSDNPIVLHNRTRRFEFLAAESEIYFPISPDYLIYLHFPGSKDKRNKMRGYSSNSIHEATDSQNEGLQKMIIRNSIEYLIVAGEFKYKNGAVLD